MFQVSDASGPEHGLHNQGVQSSDAAPEKRRKTLGSLLRASPFQKKQNEDSAATTDSIIQSEINSYLMTPILDSEADPLSWWREQKINYPHLSEQAKKYLCIPATSCPSERLFSCSGNIVTCSRASLKPDKVDMLVFLAKNLD